MRRKEMLERRSLEEFALKGFGMPIIRPGRFFRAGSIALVVMCMLFAVTAANADCGKPNGFKFGPAAKIAPGILSNGNGGGNRHRSIVGLWHVTYLLPDGTFFFQSFEQFHSDGNEFEGAALGPGAFCQGTWKQTAPGTVQLFHLGWNFDPSGNLIGYFTETQTEKLSGDGNSYQGTFDMKNFDLNGNPDPILGEVSGTLSATRIKDSFTLGG
jgi:hypothetical protein